MQSLSGYNPHAFSEALLWVSCYPGGMEDTQEHGELHVSGQLRVARETKCIYTGKLMQTLGLNLSTKKVIRSCINNCQMKVGTPRGGSGRGFSHQLPLHFTGWEGVETKAHKG